MSLAEHTSLVQTLLDHPGDERTLFAAYETLRKDPKDYVALLVTAAETTDQDIAASHWLTEAARVEVQALRDARGSARLLEAALERDPFNLRAVDHLIELYRVHRLDDQLAELLRTCATRLNERHRRDSAGLPRAAVAFEKLASLYEAVGDPAAALLAVRTALELERARARHTTPSPPPDGPPESSFRSLTGDPAAPSPTPAPGSPWTINPESDARDTLPVQPRDKSAPRSVPPEVAARSSAPPPRVEPAPGDPLFAMIELLHALRHSDDVVEGAALVLRTALDAIPAKAAIVHVADVATRDFVVVAASGEHNAEVIGTRASDADPVFARAFHGLQAVSIETGAAATGSGTGWFVGARWHTFSPKHSVLCAAVHFDGRHLGAIELIDPTRKSGFSDADRNAMTYVGERFGEFLADRSFAF